LHGHRDQRRHRCVRERGRDRRRRRDRVRAGAPFARRLSRRDEDVESGDARAAVRRARPGGAREGADHRQRRAHQGQADRRTGRRRRRPIISSRAAASS
jgi:hypothetical protein